MWQSQGHHPQQQPQQHMAIAPANYTNSPHHNGVHHNLTYNGHNGQSPGTPNSNGNQHTWFSEASFMSNILTGTTPTLTPTTIASIEQSFIELQSAPVTTASNTAPTAGDLSHQAGFVPPVVDPRTSVSGMPIKTEYDYYTEDDSRSSDAEWMPVAKRSRPDQSSGQSVITYGQATTSTGQTGAPQRKTPGRKAKNDVLSPNEDAKRRVRRERNKLAAAKCRQRRVDHTNELLGETEDLEEIRAKLESEVQQLQQQKEQLEFLLEAHKPMCTVAKLIVKPDPDLTNVSQSTKVDTGSSVVTSTASFSTQTIRPTSLPLTVQNLAVSEAPGVAVTTPSNVFTQLGLDSLMDGHSSGLTPITGCSREVKRQSSDSSPSDNGLASPTRLMAL